MWSIIATWCMAKDGVHAASECLSKGGLAADAIVMAIEDVENNPYYKSVGYGGLPNEDMVVELDAAFMDGTTMAIGAVGAIRDFKNPIRIARHLSSLRYNNFLVGPGAEQYAHKEGFERVNMLSDRAKTHYYNRLKEQGELKAYRGHDTVGMVCLDSNGHMVSGTSTSGLFMKKQGRVGDSPVIGSGLYVDSMFGGASATGVGEDLMKGCISYAIVNLIASGHSVQEACELAVFQLEAKLLKQYGCCGDLSVIALDCQGNFGAASTIDAFSFVVSSETQEPTIYVSYREGNTMRHERASDAWIEAYQSKRTQPVELL